MGSGGGFTFSQVPTVQVPRSSFNRSHGHKTTFDAGYLVPIFVDEALPGDTFSVKLHALARLATPIYPIMDNLYLDFFFFAVPNRLVWDDWQHFCGEAVDTGYNGPNDFTVPQLAAASWDSLSLGDYMGLPTGVNIEASALFMRAYNLIWNEWFRDENLQSKIPVPKGAGPDPVANYVVRKRGKRHDYFTSCLPWPQKGPAVEVPIGVSAPVVDDGTSPSWRPGGGTNNPATLYLEGPATSTGVMNMYGLALEGTPGGLGLWGNTGLRADLTEATAVTINALREAFQVQRMYEKDARGGTRYTELLRSHFGVISPDARLQRPEFLGGGSVPVTVNPVTQTSQTTTGQTDPSPQGNLAAFGVAGVRGLGFSKSFTEHSIIIGMVEARSDMTYQQGLSRMWTRKTRFEFYWPSLAHLGEQAVKKREIYCDGTAGDEEVFGYQERWAEYRYFPSRVSGVFRSNYPAGQTPNSLDAWHLAFNFPSRPSLGASFIEDDPPVDRVIAVQSEPHFLFDSHFSIRCARPMPTYSVPGLIDHF